MNVDRPASRPANGQVTAISVAPAATATIADTKWIQPRARGRAAGGGAAGAAAAGTPVLPVGMLPVPPRLGDRYRDYRSPLLLRVVWVAVAIIPARLKEPMYRVYEMRLRQELAAHRSQLPRHIAVLCDGNRRWARDAGYDDVSYGYRMGAAKIAEMLRWCAEAGIEMATIYLLSTENLQRDPDELGALIEIITDVVEEICAPANRWSVRTVGDLELLGEEPARRLRDAVEGATATQKIGRASCRERA